MTDRTPMQVRIEAAAMQEARPARLIAPGLAAVARQLANASGQAGQRRAALLADLRPHAVPLAIWLAMDEAARLEAIAAAATPPEACGPDVPMSPARGPVRTFTPTQIKPGSAGTLEHAGYRGEGETAFRKALVQADVFDLMERDALRRHMRQARNEPFVPPFSPAQVQVGRRYRELVETVDVGRMRCASAEAQTGNGGGIGAGGYSEAMADDIRELARLRVRIGARVALGVRRVRPSARGPGGRPIPDRQIVDLVCISQRSLSAVLEAFGWSLRGGNVAKLQVALSDALDRMVGHHTRSATR